MTTTRDIAPNWMAARPATVARDPSSCERSRPPPIPMDPDHRATLSMDFLEEEKHLSRNQWGSQREADGEPFEEFVTKVWDQIAGWRGDDAAAEILRSKRTVMRSAREQGEKVSAIASLFEERHLIRD